MQIRDRSRDFYFFQCCTACECTESDCCDGIRNIHGFQLCAAEESRRVNFQQSVRQRDADNIAGEAVALDFRDLRRHGDLGIFAGIFCKDCSVFYDKIRLLRFLYTDAARGTGSVCGIARYVKRTYGEHGNAHSEELFHMEPPYPDTERKSKRLLPALRKF